MAAMKLAGTEKRRSTEQKNTVTMGVTARELGAQVMRNRKEARGTQAAVCPRCPGFREDPLSPSVSDRFSEAVQDPVTN